MYSCAIGLNEEEDEGMEPIGVISVNEVGVRCCRVVVWCRLTEGRRGWEPPWWDVSVGDCLWVVVVML
jgi:hypothetical protein